MSKFYHFSFAHLSFKILLTCVMVVMLCLWVPLPLTTITALARRDSWDTLDGRGRWWPSAKEEKKQKRKVIVLLCFTVTTYQRLKCTKHLFKNPKCYPLHMSQHQEPTSEHHEETIHKLPSHWLLYWKRFTCVSTLIVSGCEQASPKSAK